MPVFDPTRLLEEYGDETLVRELARLLVETLPPQMEAVRGALAAGDGAALRAAAHKLRGSITPFGMNDAADLSRRLEAAATAGDAAGAQPLAQQLLAAVQVLRDSAGAWLDEREQGLAR